MRVANRPRRFLISRLSAIGDSVLSMPVACALRDRFPDAFIAWVVEPLAAPLLRQHDSVDEVVVVPRRWWKSPSELWRLRGRLQSLNIDTSIDVQSLTKSALAARLSGARQRIGFDGELGRELSRRLNNRLVRPTRDHVVDCFLELLAPLGIERPEARFSIPHDREADTAMTELVARVAPGQTVAIVNPGAGWPSKVWPSERFGAVAARLGQERGVTSLVVWHGEQELAWARDIVARSAGQAVLAPKTNLVQLAALLRLSQLMVSGDSAPLHVAAAVGTPCVGLLGTSRAERCGPYGTGNVALQEYYQAGTSRQRRSAENLAMQAIPVEKVCAACHDMLDRAETKPSLLTMPLQRVPSDADRRRAA